MLNEQYYRSMPSASLNALKQYLRTTAIAKKADGRGGIWPFAGPKGLQRSGQFDPAAALGGGSRRSGQAFTYASRQDLLFPPRVSFAMLKDFGSRPNFQVDSVPAKDLGHTCIDVDQFETATMIDAALPRRRMAEYLRDVVGVFRSCDEGIVTPKDSADFMSPTSHTVYMKDRIAFEIPNL